VKKRSVVAATVLGLALVAIAATNNAAARGQQEILEFDELRFFLEANETDGDAEIVLDFDSEESSLRFLDIHAPNGRRILRLASNDGKRLGLRKGILESPEPAPEDVLAAYPEGVYTFKGRSVDNAIVRGQVTLSHELPPSPVITSPEAEAEDVSLNGLGAEWNTVEGATGYVVELERETDDGEFVLKVDIPADTTSFTFPPGWVLPDTEYQLGVAVKGENGNVSVTEIQFTTGS
jgi:hypothetical protein